MEKVSIHKSVLLEESINLLKPEPGKLYLDATFGGGGHSRAILEASGGEANLVVLDRDPKVSIYVEQLDSDFPDKIDFHCLSFDQVETLGQHFDGIIADLGMSSDQLESSGRGFSFSKNEPLDLRFNDSFGQTAAQFLMQSSAVEIERVFKEYGEDRFAKKLAVRIATERRKRPIKTTSDFVSYVGTENPKVLAPLFQALRIATNDELYVLKKGLNALTNCLSEGATLAVISFHSLEDRIVKQFLRSREDLEIFTSKPLTPTEKEIANNPRSRSAKLRAAKKK